MLNPPTSKTAGKTPRKDRDECLMLPFGNAFTNP